MQSDRIIVKTLVFAQNIPTKYANKDSLCSNLLFGRYGNIKNCIVYSSDSKLQFNKVYNFAYISFHTDVEAANAIVGLDKHKIADKILKVTYGTNKYCNYYLNGKKCFKRKCPYIHYRADPSLILNSEELNDSRTFILQKLLATKIATVKIQELQIIHKCDDDQTSNDNKENILNNINLKRMSFVDTHKNKLDCLSNSSRKKETSLFKTIQTEDNEERLLIHNQSNESSTQSIIINGFLFKPAKESRLKSFCSINTKEHVKEPSNDLSIIMLKCLFNTLSNQQVEFN